MFKKFFVVLRTSKVHGYTRPSLFSFSSSKEPTNLDKIGGPSALAVIVKNFYAKMMLDPLVSNFFKGADIDILLEKQTGFISEILGGQNPYKDINLKSAHSGLGIKHYHFERMKQHLVTSMKDHNVPIEIIKQVDAAFESHRKSITIR